MSGREDQKIQVQQATDIVRLVGEDVALKPRGREFVCLCPFHDDTNPSMNVIPAKQIYHCFVCKAGGDVFSWMMQYHKMTFPQALEYLAERAGIRLDQTRGRGESSDEGPSLRQRLLDANAAAAGFFRALFRHEQHGQAARQYVGERGISDQMLEQFQIGYAPDRWDGLVTMIQRKGWDQKAFEAAGLISQRSGGDGCYDRLRHRLIFPICDALGRPIAFGGRKLRPEDEPKYLNSPESPLFNKSATLFGLHLAKQQIIADRTAVIVEGYTDVIACHQAQQRNVVAALGTSLTGEHVSQLRHYADKVVLVFDADEAGQTAADRAVELFLTSQIDVHVAVLPEGTDPADLLAEPAGVEQWQTILGKAVDALEYQFTRLRKRYEDAQTLTGRESIVRDYLQRLGQMGLDRSTPIRRSLVVQRLAELLHVPENDIHEQLRRVRPSPRRTPAPAVSASIEDEMPPEQSAEPDWAQVSTEPTSPAIAAAQRQVIGCLLKQPHRFGQTLVQGRPLDEALTPAAFRPPTHRLYEIVYHALADGTELTLSQLLAELASRHEADLARLVIEADAEVDAFLADENDDVEQRMEQILRDAAECILDQQQRQLYHRDRQQIVELNRQSDDQAETTDQEQLLRRIEEYNRRPHAVRIARMPMEG